MASSQSLTVGATIIIVFVSLFILRQQRQASKTPAAPRAAYPLADSPLSELPKHIQLLLAELPESVILQSDVAAFQEALDYSWAQTNREIIPAAVVRPNDVRQLSAAVSILGREHARRRQTGISDDGFFTVRSGGANPSLGTAAGRGGVVLDLSRFSEVTPSVERTTVAIGAGARWNHVYNKLEKQGLTTGGGRMPPVGVGGFTTQGGISFYSGQHGFVCSSVLEFQVVLADGTVVTASATSHSELFRALKGGSSNFGLVTRITLPAWPSKPVWWTRRLAPAVMNSRNSLKAFHEYHAQASSGRPGTFDEHAAAVILSFNYLQALGFQISCFSIVHTEAPQNKSEWPSFWKGTGIPSLRSLYRQYGTMTHGGVVEDYGTFGPAGTRHSMGTTTIRNDLAMLNEAYDVFCSSTRELRHVKGLQFPFICQGILPAWMNKGSPNVLGLEGCEEPLVICSVSVAWSDAKDDEHVRSVVRRMLERIEDVAAAKGVGHPFKFMNYCSEWQRPFDGRGDEILSFMQGMSRKYDPEGLFQTGCAGGFKLPMSGSGSIQR